MKKTAAKFTVEYLQVVNEKGAVDKKLEPKLKPAQLKELYKWMVIERVFDSTAVNLQREGRIGTYAGSLGEEAVHVGATYAAGKSDWIFPDYREHASWMMRGVPIKDLLISWGGSEDGMQVPKDSRIFPMSIPVGTQTLHGAGMAIANKIKKEKSGTVTFVGDAATSTGDFNEGLNFAGTFMAPAVFVIRNNQWAISVPRVCENTSWGGCQTRAKTLAQKGLAYGLHCIQVDGNDILAVYVAVKEALERAKKGKGPTVIECVCYRLGPHTTADDPTRYVNSKTLKEWEKKEPVLRFQKYLKKKKVWTPKFESAVQAEAKKLVDTGVKEFEKHESKITDMFDYVYSELTPNLKEQRDTLG